MTNGNRLAGARIFIVEDEALVSLMLEAMVEDFGATVAGTGRHVEEALDFIGHRHHDIDVVLLDINLSGLHSYKVAEAAQGHRIPIVFSTGYNDISIAEAWRGNPLLTKPFQIGDLQKALSDAITPPISAS